MAAANDKNPISVINEFCLSTNSRVFFEFINDDSDFIARVIHNGVIIGEGRDRKKQSAKLKAAQIALKQLLGNACESKETREDKIRILEKDIASLLVKLGRTGKYRLTFKDPVFIYTYFLAEEIIAEAKCITEPSAKFKCMKKVLNKLKTMFENVKNKEKSLGNQGFLEKNQEVNREILIQTEKLLLNIFDAKTVLFLEDAVKKISQMIEVNIVSIGSHSLKSLRKEKQVLDYCVVDEKITETSIFSIQQLIEKLYPVSPSNSGISSDLVRNDQKFPYIRLSFKTFKVHIYFYDSPLHPCLIHYDMMRKQVMTSPLIKTAILLRHWKQRHNITIPVELLDLLLYDLIEPTQSLSSSFRLIMEHLASGLLLPGSPRAPNLPEYKNFLMNCAASQLYRASAEALQTLYIITQGGFLGTF
jgi:hypothetical protein